MNYQFCLEFPNPMLLKSGEPCISIYMPTHRLIFDNKQDALVFKNLCKEVKLSLEKKYASRDTKFILSLLKKAEEDNNLWNHSLDGLAIFATLDEMILYRLEKEVQPLSIVSDNFHIKPLIKYFQAVETFSLLALSADSFELYVANHLEIKPMVLSKDVETTLSEVLGTQLTDGYHTHGSYGGSSERSTFHGHGGKSDEVDVDRMKFFKHVDRFVLEEVSKKYKYPLILVAHKAYHFDFKKLSNNSFLIDETIDGSYSDYEENELKDAIKTISENRINVFIDQALIQYHNLKEQDLSSDQIIIVLKALLISKVDTLFIEEHKIIPGKIDVDNQQIIQSDLDDPKTDDLLDDMVQHALLNGTKVYMLKPDKMPTTSGVAAIFRY